MSTAYARLTLLASFFYAQAFESAGETPHQDMIDATTSSAYATAQTLDHAAGVMQHETDDYSHSLYNTYYPAFRDNGETWEALMGTLELLHRNEPPMRVIDPETAHVAADREYLQRDLQTTVNATRAAAPTSPVMPHPLHMTSNKTRQQRDLETAQAVRSRSQYNRRDLPRSYEPRGYQFYDRENAEIDAYFFNTNYYTPDLDTRHHNHRMHKDAAEMSYLDAVNEDFHRSNNRAAGLPDDAHLYPIR